MNDDKKIKVLICCPYLSVYGGVANYYRVLKDYIEEKQYTNFFFFEAGGKGGGIWSLLNFFCEPWLFLYALLANSDIDVVIVNPSLLSRAIIRNAFFLLIAKIFGKKVVVFWRGFNPVMATLIKKKFSYWFVKIFSKADISLVLAKEFRETLVEIGLRHPIFTTTTIVDMRYLGVNGLTCTNEHMKVVFLSRLDRNKGIYEALEAFKILRQKYKRICLAIIGGGGEYSQLVQKYGDVPGVKFYGYLSGEDKYHILHNADIFVFPSYWEGMPNSVLEAMSCGLPVVTSLVGGLKDFFRDGINGFVLPDRDPETIAMKVAELIDNGILRKKISKYNKSFSVRNFSPEKKLDFLLKLSEAMMTGDVQKIPEDWFVCESITRLGPSRDQVKNLRNSLIERSIT